MKHGAAPTQLQGEPSEAATVAAYVAHIEQGLGEVVRRLEKKVDGVAQLLDQVHGREYTAADWRATGTLCGRGHT